MFYLRFLTSLYIGCHRPKQVGNRSVVSVQHLSIKNRYLSTYFTFLMHKVFLLVIFLHITNSAARQGRSEGRKQRGPRGCWWQEGQKKGQDRGRLHRELIGRGIAVKVILMLGAEMNVSIVTLLSKGASRENQHTNEYSKFAVTFLCLRGIKTFKRSDLY